MYLYQQTLKKVYVIYKIMNLVNFKALQNSKSISYRSLLNLKIPQKNPGYAPIKSVTEQ